MDIHADDGNDGNDGWQFGRFAPASNGPIYHPLESADEIVRWANVQGKVVRVRPIIPHTWIVRAFRSAGCDSNIFMTVHPDDLTRLGIVSYPTQVTCEHVIYTD